MRTKFGATCLITLLTLPLAAQQSTRPSSPTGSAATQIGGSWVKKGNRDAYEGGKWLEITYSRPILRQRGDLFAGEPYGAKVLAGAPVWRVGANKTTRLLTEAPLKIGDKVVPAGEYSLFIDLEGPQDWTLILSSWGALERYDPNAKDALWGSYGYTPDKDVARAKMTVGATQHSVDQLTIGFVDIDGEGGAIAIAWGKTLATVPFTVAE
jgi:hypothetical protein